MRICGSVAGGRQSGRQKPGRPTRAFFKSSRHAFFKQEVNMIDRSALLASLAESLIVNDRFLILCKYYLFRPLSTSTADRHALGEQSCWSKRTYFIPFESAILN